MSMVPSWARPAVRPRSRPARRRAPDHKSRLRTLALEPLEARALMAVLPAATVNAQVGVSSDPGNENSPSVAIDPNNPQKLVAVWTRNDPTNLLNNGQTAVYVEGAVSLNGGTSWSALSNLNNTQIDFGRNQNGGPFFFPTVTDASVAFGPGDQFYVLSMFHNDADAAGEIQLQKFSLTGNSATPVQLAASANNGATTVTPPGGSNPVYEWSGANPAYKPTLAVDANRASFADTTSAGQPYTQTDPFVGNVYVAWSTNNNTANIPGTPNPNVIELTGSADGGNTFAPPVLANSTGNFGLDRDSAPQIAISQGRPAGAAGPAVPGGQVSVIWDDSGAGRQPGAVAPTDFIKANRVANGVTTADFLNNTFTGSNGGTAVPVTGGPSTPTGAGIAQAIGNTGAPNTPVVTSFPLNVNITNPNFVVSNLNAVVSLAHGSLNEIAIDLVSPATPARPNGIAIRLLNNRTNADNSGNNTGIAGSNLGQAANGSYLGTTFDSNAIQAISLFGGPSPAHFAPDGGSLLTSFAGLLGNSAAISGTWFLRVTDFGVHTNPPAQNLVSFALNFTSGLTVGTAATVAATTIQGAVANNTFPLKPAAAPDQGIGPGAVIASDNTLGAYSPHEGRLYVAFTAHPTDASGVNTGPADNTNIGLAFSDDGGASWTTRSKRINDDNPTADGYSQGDRPQFQPAITVDQATGTVVFSDLDARDDAARARVATYVGASIDGGQTFNPQAFANPPDQAQDAIKVAGGVQGAASQIVRGPIPDNQSSGNPTRDATYGFGAHQAIVAFNGQVYPVWASNQNGGIDGKKLLSIHTARMVIAAGPRVVASTQGPIGVAGDTLNTARAADGTPELTTIQVTFDRPVNAATFTPAEFRLFYRDTNVNDAPVRITAGLAVTPVSSNAFGATVFNVTFPAQTGLGTYSYEVGPDVQTSIPALVTGGGGTVLQAGAKMDQNANGTTGEALADIYAVPRPTGGVSSATSLPGGPYDQDTLPVIVPGPVVVATLAHHADGTAPTPAGRPVADSGVDGMVVVFDRDMDKNSLPGSAVTRVMGPAGLIPGPFTISYAPTGNPSAPDAANHPRTFLIRFPASQTQVLSGTYTVTFGPGLHDIHGNALDENHNAGLYLLDAARNPNAATTQVVYTAPVTAANPAPIRAATTDPLSGAAVPSVATATVTVTDPSLILGVTVRLDIAYPNDPDLAAYLVAPDGTTVKLFDRIPQGNTNNHANFSTTTFSDNANPLTPIANGGAPFFGTFNPEQALATIASPQNLFNPAINGGVWTLRVLNYGTVNTGAINGFTLSLTKPVPDSGLGETVADLASASFRIFAMNPTNALASSVWTAVGPASIGGGGGGGAEGGGSGGRSGRIGGIAVDPSDPSGNTVFIGGASGGIWKTTDFLNPNGPVYIPLTDFGPTFAINIGSIAVFPRNNDPNQSIVFAATGEGDTGSNGVGVLRSMDGGATWTLLDSTNNNLPFSAAAGQPQRDHAFAGTSAFKLVVDPRLTPDGKVVVYMALSGGNGGIWRSTDSGQTWGILQANGTRTANLAGQATDLVLDPASATGGSGNLQGVYAALRGQGVYASTNEGQTFNLVLGNVGDPLIQARDNASSPVNVIPAPGSEPTPNGAFGRIVLAKPFLTGNQAEDLNYQGWLYAAVVDGSSHFQGLYVTKDFGQNWTKVGLPNLPPVVTNGVAAVPAAPSNDPTLGDYDIGGGPAGTGLPAQGNYDFSLAIDPTNPNVVYLGGTADGQPTGFIRIDITGIKDPHALVPFNNRAPDGGLLQFATNASTGPASPPVTLKDPTKPLLSQDGGSLLQESFFNYFRNPGDPFGTATLSVSNVTQFNNIGATAKWIPFDIGGTDQHRIVTFVDPATGHARIIIGDDQGVFSAVDNDGTFDPGIGTAADPGSDRNGNLQITQFYYGAVQPSLAAQIAGDLFIGSAQDNGGPLSAGGVLTPGDPNYGNIVWGGPGGDAAGVAVDQQGSGTLYQYWWPCCGGNGTSFFQVNGVGRTQGLLQQALPGPSPDPQWPTTGGSNFALNPLTDLQVVMSSQAGRVFLTENQGLTWSVIGNPTALDGSYVPAPAFGAPDPNSPAGIGNLDNFIYAGTGAGSIFVTQTAGGGVGGGGNGWVNTTPGGLGTGPVQAIVTDPTRGSHRAYAVTSQGIYFNPNSVPTPALSGKPAVPASPWINITGNIFRLTGNPFGDPSLNSTLLRGLTSIAADWRYAIPDDPTVANSPTHPILYAGGQGGVFRSLDNGKTWAPFPQGATIPTTAAGSTLTTVSTPTMGYLPVTDITDLQTALGAINPTTGRPQAQVGDPNVLTASTYGNGFYSIRLAPVVFPNTAAQPNLLTFGVQNVSTGTVTPVPTGGTIASTKLVVKGFSEQTAFGNMVTVNLIDETPLDTTFGQVVGSALTDATGHFVVNLTNPAFGANGNGSVNGDGPKLLGAQATDASGTAGNIATFSFILQRTPPSTLPTPTLDPASDTGITGETTLNRFTNDNSPTFDVAQALAGPATVQLYRKAHDPAHPNDTTVTDYTLVGTATGGASNGTPITVQDPGPVPTGTYDYVVLQVDASGLAAPGVSTPALTVTIDTIAPPRASAPTLQATSNTGPAGTNQTNVNQPVLVGTLPLDPSAPPNEPLPSVQIIQQTSLGTFIVLGSAQVTLLPDGTAYAYAVRLNRPLPDGTYTLLARAQDVAGNLGAVSTGGAAGTGGVTVTIITTKPPAATLALDPVEFQTGQAAPSPANPALVITRVVQPLFFGNAGSGLTVDLVELKPNAPDLINLTDPANFIVLQGNVPVQNNGQALAPYSAMPAAPLAANDPGAYTLFIRTRDLVGNTSLSNPLFLQVKTQGPTVAPTLALAPASDSGLKGDNVTSVRRPVFTGHAEAFAQVALINLADPNGPALGSAQADANGNFTISNLPADLVNGRDALAVREHDVVNNPGPFSPTLVLSIVTTAGDYFGTNSADLAVFGQNNAVFSIVGPGGAAISQQFGAGQLDIPVGGDFNGDGRDDLVTFRPTGQANASPAWSLAYSGGGAQIISFGTPNSIPVPGYYDGPGKDDLATYDPANGHWSIFSFNFGVRYDISFNFEPGDIPAPGKYLGDGKTDLAVYRPALGQLVVLNTNARPGTSALVTYTLPGARAGDVPLTGDFFGDGRDDPAVYRPSDGTWIILRTANMGVDTLKGFSGGGPDVVPVPLDFNGDGFTDVASYRRPQGSNVVGTWTILDYAGTGSLRTQQFIGSDWDLAIDAPEPLRTPRAPSSSPAPRARAAAVAATPVTIGAAPKLGQQSLKLAAAGKSATPAAAVAVPHAAVLQAAAVPTTAPARSRPAQPTTAATGHLHDAAIKLLARP